MTKFIDIEIKQNQRDEFFLTAADTGALITIEKKFLFTSKDVVIKHLKEWNQKHPDQKYIIKNIGDKDPVKLEKVDQS